MFLSLLYITSYTLQELYTLRLDRIYIYSFKSSLKPLHALILHYVKTIIIKMANEPKSLLITISIITLVREQLTIIQQSFIDALAQQQAILEVQHQQLIEALYKELYNVKALIIETPTPPTNEINITISELSPLNTDSKPVIVT